MKKILITGAAGKIGQHITNTLMEHTNYQLRLADINLLPLRKFKKSSDHDVIYLDVSSLEACQEACKNVDIVIHLAGDPSQNADFYSSLLENTIKGSYNIFKAASDNGVSRVVAASSAQAVEGYPLDFQVTDSSPVRPKNMYGVSKCFVEALASYFAYEKQLQSIAIRIGAYDDYKPEGQPLSARDMSAYISPEDFSDLLLKTITTKNLPPFSILHGISDNRFKRLNIEETKRLVAYTPYSDAFKLSGIQFF
ncbi:NAD(P)-dependent oxidoreductase [Lysinibacillus sphaericus]|uniref:NAD(P)-dependent oxidoreductase n=1 Tax=Lysinibacillus sphaericus TaxID=1421 RepID=A0A544UT19_LYSSH|nr:NAD(P)-dependent oxidoreductase [Lysinibacillus sp. SDF0037]TQR36995.1 NAD(P)-dependent oxidoreductase [Lysinibacillus sp. SDF0037]